jgi:hypothetical protein
MFAKPAISDRAIMRSPPPASRRMLLTDQKKANPMVALSTRALFWIAKINLALCRRSKTSLRPWHQPITNVAATLGGPRLAREVMLMTAARADHHARQRLITRKT